MPQDSLPAKTTYPITFKLEGPGLEHGISIHDIAHVFGEFQAIVDKSYLSLAEKRRISSEERKRYSIVATDFRRGSLIADLQLGFIAGVSTLQGVQIVGLQPAEIWEVTKKGYEYLKLLLGLRSKGESPKVQITGDKNLSIINRDGNITVNHYIVDAADHSESNYKRLTRTIQAGGIETISSLDRGGAGISLDEADRDLFNPKTRMDQGIYQIAADIVRFDKVTGKGKVNVPEGQSVPPGPYSFKAIQGGSRIDFILSMTKSGVVLSVLKEMAVHPSGIEHVASLHVVSIDGDVTKPLFPPQLDKG